MNAGELAGVAREAGDALGLKVVRFCGKGAFKETYEAVNSKSETFAFKLVPRSRIDEARTTREIEALARCSTPRVAKFVRREIFTANDGNKYDIVIEEFLSGGSLEQRITRMSGDEVLQLARGLAHALQDLYPLRLVHRDIKPANVMFRDGSADPVLVDFGLVRDLAQTSLTVSWLPHGPGTPFYAPPEQLNNEKALIDWRADQFAIGVMASVAITGRHPYQSASLNPLEVPYAVLERRPISAEFIAAVSGTKAAPLVRMVQPWPVQRYSSPDALIAAVTT